MDNETIAVEVDFFARMNDHRNELILEKLLIRFFLLVDIKNQETRPGVRPTYVLERRFHLNSKGAKPLKDGYTAKLYSMKSKSYDRPTRRLSEQRAVRKTFELARLQSHPIITSKSQMRYCS